MAAVAERDVAAEAELQLAAPPFKPAMAVMIAALKVCMVTGVCMVTCIYAVISFSRVIVLVLGAVLIAQAASIAIGFAEMYSSGGAPGLSIPR